MNALKNRQYQEDTFGLNFAFERISQMDLSFIFVSSVQFFSAKISSSHLNGLILFTE
jgi:hypothetical protein